MYVSSDSKYGYPGEEQTIMEISSNPHEAEEYTDYGKAKEIKDAIGGQIYERKNVEVMVESVTRSTEPEHVFETESVLENVRKIQKVEENARSRGTVKRKINPL